MTAPPGTWRPPTFPKQDAIRWAVHPDNPDRTPHLCVSGPRKSSKTVGCLHALVEHAWEVDRALVAIISPTVTAATDGGCWQILVEEIIPQWIEGDFGLEWHRKPYQESVSKRFKCSVRNKHGTISTFQLESFREGATEKDIAARFKNKKFSAMYFMEAATWIATRKAYDITSECLREKAFWKKNCFTMIFDTNPEAPGEDHWLYQLFYVFRKTDETVLAEMVKDKGISIQEMKQNQRRLGLIEVFVTDNLALAPEDISELKAKYAHSPDLWERYFNGRWTNASGDSLFYDVFRPAIHVVGQMETPLNPDPEILVPSENAYALVTGWDPGVSNYAGVILDKYDWPDSSGKIMPHFSVIDELVWLHGDNTIGEFTEEFLRKMDFWEHHVGKALHWTHYADRSAFDYRESISDRRQHVEVAITSRQRIRLRAVEKWDGSVRQRVDILRKLLHQDRILFSKAKCPHTVAMLQALKKGKNTPVDKQSPHKHAFDALTYALQQCCLEELFRAAKAQFAKPSQSSHISIRL